MRTDQRLERVREFEETVSRLVQLGWKVEHIAYQHDQGVHFTAEVQMTYEPASTGVL